MIHIYAVLSTPKIETAITKGKTDFLEPQNNRSVRHSLDNSKAIIEGMFTNEEYAWFIENALLVGDAVEMMNYIATNREEWETQGLGD